MYKRQVLPVNFIKPAVLAAMKLRERYFMRLPEYPAPFIHVRYINTGMYSVKAVKNFRVKYGKRLKIHSCPKWSLKIPFLNGYKNYKRFKPKDRMK